MWVEIVHAKIIITVIFVPGLFCLHALHKKQQTVRWKGLLNYADIFVIYLSTSEALNSVDFQGQETCTGTHACTLTKNKQAKSLLKKMILKTQSKSGHLNTMLNSTGKSICNTSTQGNNILVLLSSNEETKG